MTADLLDVVGDHSSLWGGKAETLDLLRGRLERATILDAHHFAVREWVEDRAGVTARLVASGMDFPLIVRSSASSEDSERFSAAGKYLSVLGVSGVHELACAVDAVVDSYGPDLSLDADRVLVQPQLSDVRASGVATACDPSTGAPYKVVSWANGPDTDVVTSGRGEVRVWYGGPDAVAPDPVARVVDLLDELVGLFGHDQIEAEFGVSGQGLVLFQARPLLVRGRCSDVAHHARLVRTTRRRLELLCATGEPQVFGTMPDWNPAEMIGVRPRALARSLYATLITDSAWAEARAECGYRDLTGTPLMHDLGGHAFIDVRASLGSLLPAGVPEALAQDLVTHQLGVLHDHPELHDRIEFDLAVSCAGPLADRKLRALEAAGFDRCDLSLLREELVRLTHELVGGEGTSALLGLVAELPETSEGLGVGEAVEVCRDLGTRPFASLARAGFVAVELLEGLVADDAMARTDADRLMRSLATDAGRLPHDLQTLPVADFLERYGHLRPGTYDILSPRYDAAPEHYFPGLCDTSAPSSPAAESPCGGAFVLDAGSAARIEESLLRSGLRLTAGELLDFVTRAVVAREDAKFAFSRLVSAILERVAAWGEGVGLDRDQLSHLPVDVVVRMMEGGCAVNEAAEVARREREQHLAAASVRLPPVLTGPLQVDGFELPASTATFVTQLSATGRVADVDAGDEPTGAIALVASADPGYDWLFARGIKALVTAYGGVNSHMAIRAQELGVPAVIGAGEVRLAQWRQCHVLEIDCLNQVVRRVR